MDPIVKVLIAIGIAWVVAIGLAVFYWARLKRAEPTITHEPKESPTNTG